MPIQNLELILIFISIIIGMVSLAYFYQSSSIFVNILKQPLQLISSGMMLMMLGVLLAAFITVGEINGVTLTIVGVPVQALFYVIYIVGSVFIFMGAKQFSRKPVN
jgi:hypothetical protein